MTVHTKKICVLSYYNTFLFSLISCLNAKYLFQNNNKIAQCRMDWHQTGTYIFVTVFAKKYLPSQSTIKLNPIHLTVDLFFIEDSAKYNLDIELNGVRFNNKIQ